MFKKWKQKLKEKLNMINKDDRGSAFVFVIIGITFTAILGATVLSVATNYVITEIVDHYSTDNFYKTEGLISEVRSGIEEVCGESNESAYMGVINEYNSKKGNMRDEYGTNYLLGIVRSLSDDNNINWDGISTQSNTFDMRKKIKKMTTNPDAVYSSYTDPDWLEYTLNYDSDTKERTLTIKGLVADYTDEEGYKTKVETDINIQVPDYQFEGGDTFDQLKDYIVICDDVLKVTGTAPSNVLGADFIGNVYAGGDVPAGSSKYETGISVSPQTRAYFESDMIISRGDLKVYTGADVSVAGEGGNSSSKPGELWVKNVTLDGDTTSLLTTNLRLNTNSYVLDDLSVEDDNTIVDLGGTYYGYSYNQKNTDEDGTMRSDYSSAILINGKNSTLQTDNLSKLVLAGRTFVNRKDENDNTLVSDILMGESLAVKSNQIAYLLPAEYIVGERNPLTKDEVAGKDILSDDVINYIKLKADPSIWTYLDEDEPVTANYSNTGGYVFLYLNFKEPAQQNANTYFAQYYMKSENRAMLNEKAETYISTTDLSGMKLSANLYLLAGNIIHNYYDGGILQSPNYYNASGRPNASMLNDGIKRMQNYLGKQLTLVNSGYKSSMTEYRYELLSDAQFPQYENADGSSRLGKELVKDVIINFGEITSEESYYDDEADGTILVTPGDYTIDHTSPIHKGIIIAAGDVTVKANFTGLILTQGKVSVEGQNLIEQADSQMVDTLLEFVKRNEDWAKYFYGLDGKKKNSINVAECIHYENWSRN